VKAATTDAEKLALFNAMQGKLQNKKASKADERNNAASKLQARTRGRNARCVAKGGDDVKAVFTKFANFGKSKRQAGGGDDIDSSRFRKMMKESKLLHKKKFNKTSCDMLHTSCKAKGSKKMTFNEFITKGVPKVAKAWGVEEAEIAYKIANGGPQNSGTKAQYSKFYDDKETWTGVATRGGPSTTGDQITLSGMMDRKEADVRGRCQ